MIVAGHQPNYLPWLGFFEKMRLCDVFIVEDAVQYEHQGFTNRNKIKTPYGAKWLTVPIEHCGRPLMIKEVQIANEAEPDWAKRHWLGLLHNYGKAPFWSEYCELFEDIYNREWTRLFDLNMRLIKEIMGILNIKTELVFSSSLNISKKKSESVLSKCKAVGADILLSGSGGKNYLNLKRFEEEGIRVVFQDFNYPKYTQLHGEFLPNLSVVDYLFNAVKGSNQRKDLVYYEK